MVIDDIAIDLELERDSLWAFRDRMYERRIAVVYGGKSREDAYYLQNSPVEQLTFTAIMDSLNRMMLNPVHVDPTSPDFLEQVQEADVAFLCLHGEYGEDGRIQGLLDYLGKPYTGSGVLASALALNKIACKRVLLGAGIDTPAFIDLFDSSAQPSVPYPYIAKPISGGSSLGMQVLKGPEDTRILLASTSEYGPFFLEEYLQGRPLTVGILRLSQQTVTTPVIEASFAAPYYDAATKIDKFAQGLVQYLIPAPLPEQDERRVRDIAARVHDVLGCRGFSRVDFLLSERDSRAYVLEANTTPGLSLDGNFAAGCRSLGLSYDETVLAVLKSVELWTP